jgi:hypothetical protein
VPTPKKPSSDVTPKPKHTLDKNDVAYIYLSRAFRCGQQCANSECGPSANNFERALPVKKCHRPEK